MTNTEHLNRLYEAMKELQNILKKDKADDLSQLEIDLSKDKLKQMYDELLKLKAASEIDDKQEAEEKPILEEPIPEVNFVLDIDESVQEMESPLHEIETDEILAPDTKPEKESVFFQEPEVKLEEEIIVEAESDKEIILEIEPETKEEITTGDVLDLFNEKQEQELKENELSTEKQDKPIEQETVADRLQKNNLESIKSAIGINEKFFFLNELFSGDLQTYNDNIEKLDSKISLEEASLFLVELSEQFNWENESEAVEQITQMLNNKFS